MTGAASVTESTAPGQGAGAGSTPSAALHLLRVRPILFSIAKTMVEQHHYLRSMPDGTTLAFGIFLLRRLLGVVTLGVGPFNAPSMVDGATSTDCLSLTRLWLADDLPPNSASRVIGVVLRALGKHTSVKFVLSYADPSMFHVGRVYQASNWLYTGLSDAMPLYDIGDGKLRHSRSLSHAYGTHSIRHFQSKGVPVRVVPQSRKHRYVYFLEPAWRVRLRVPVLPYPKSEVENDHR